MAEWKKIGDICEIIRGNGVQKTDFVENGVGCIHYGQIYTHYGSYTYSTNKFVSIEVFDKARKASKGDIIMTDTSENVEDICKSVAYLGEEDIAVSNHALILKHSQNPKFLSYSTLTNSFLDQKRKFVVGVKVSGIKPEQLARIRIFLPSLSEQNRIVGILDTFTSSIENLKQQIAERRKQFEHYRDQLLDLEGKEGVEMKTLGEIGKCVAGATPSTKEKLYWDNGNIPWMSSGEVHQGIVSHTASYITKLGYDNSSTKMLPIGTVVIALAGQGKTRGSAAITAIELCTNQSLCGVVIENKSILNKYVYYYLRTRYNDLRRISSGEGTRGGLNLKMIGSYIVPIVSIDEQSRIVSILDTFEASIANLEAQLSQREKQYEYYRNKLLTFE